jgi:SAM-dependent methyltransferase
MQNAGAGGRARFATGRTAVLMRLPKSIAWRLPKKGVSDYVRWLAGEGIRANSRIADVGSGEGKLLRSLARDGFTDVWGFDPFIKGDLDEGSIHLRQASLDGMFDLIMFNHSLEHTADPLQELDTAVSHLNPGGRVLIRIPIAGSWADRTYGPHWVSLDAPRHLSIPSESGMRKLIERADAELCFMHYESYPFQFSGSERYRRGLSLDAPLPVDDQLSAEWVRRTEELDAAGDGDSAGFVLRATRDLPLPADSKSPRSVSGPPLRARQTRGEGTGWRGQVGRGRQARGPQGAAKSPPVWEREVVPGLVEL